MICSEFTSVQSWFRAVDKARFAKKFEITNARPVMSVALAIVSRKDRDSLSPSETYGGSSFDKTVAFYTFK